MDVLNNKFNRLLNLYQNTYEDYIQLIDSSDNSLKIVPNSTFVATNNNPLNIIEKSNENDCLASCSENSKCTAATFNSEQHLCTLNSGEGHLMKSNNQITFIRKVLFYTNELKRINEALTKINNEMMALANSKYGDFEEKMQSNTQNSETLNKNYLVLQEERFKIEELIRQYETLNSAYDFESLSATSNYYIYILYMLCALFLLFLLIKVSASNNTNSQLGGGSQWNKLYKLWLT